MSFYGARRVYLIFRKGHLKTRTIKAVDGFGSCAVSTAPFGVLTMKKQIYAAVMDTLGRSVQDVSIDSSLPRK